MERGAAQKKITKVNDRTGASISPAHLNIPEGVDEVRELDQTPRPFGENQKHRDVTSRNKGDKVGSAIEWKRSQDAEAIRVFAGFPIRFQSAFQKFSKMPPN